MKGTVGKVELQMSIIAGSPTFTREMLFVVKCSQRARLQSVANASMPLFF
jgi:hypothetical protein